MYQHFQRKGQIGPLYDSISQQINENKQGQSLPLNWAPFRPEWAGLISANIGPNLNHKICINSLQHILHRRDHDRGFLLNRTSKNESNESPQITITALTM